MLSHARGLLVCSFALTPLLGATVEGTITYEKGVSAGMLVWVPGVTHATVAPAVIDQKDKVFTPSVLAVRPGTQVTMHNSDAIQHNAFASDKTTNVNFDTGLNAPASDTIIDVNWPAGKVVKLGCKIHPAMQLWIGSLDTDAWTAPVLTDKVATFTISNVPATASSVVVWTSKFGQTDIALTAGTAATAKLGQAATVVATLKP